MNTSTKTQKSNTQNHSPAQTEHKKSSSDAHGLANLQSAIGNLALQSLVRPTNTTENSSTIQRKANTGSPDHHPQQALNLLDKSHSQTLDADNRHHFQNRLGQDLGDVRIHTDERAQQASQLLNARAFTQGQHIAFGRNYSPSSREGQRLMAHELVHVIQQRNGLATKQGVGEVNDPHEKQANEFASDLGNKKTSANIHPQSLAVPQTQGSNVNSKSIQRYPGEDEECVATEEGEEEYASGFDEPVCREPPPEEFPEPLVCEPPEAIPTTINFSWAALKSPAGDEIPGLTHSVDVGVFNDFHSDVILYAIDREEVFATEEEARYPVCEQEDIPEFDLGATPEQRGFRTPPITTYGGILWTAEGPISVVYMTPDYVVTTDYVKFATGAAAFTMVNTAEGLMLVDAGAQLPFGRGSQALAEAAVLQLVEVAAGRPIVKVILTHTHADHINVLPLLAEHMEIGIIRLTARQAERGVFQRTLAAVEQAQQVYRDVNLPSRLRSELAAQREAWVREQNVAVRSSPERLDAAWNDYVETRVAIAQEQVRFPTIELIIGNESRPVVVEADLIREPGRIRAEVPAETARGSRIAMPLREGSVTTFLHPDSDAASGFHPDTHSANLIIEMPNGEHLVVLADVRDRDITAMREQFESALREAGLAERVRILDATHHMQRGMFTRDAGGHLVSSQFLVDASRMLAQLAAEPSASGQTVRSAVVVGGDEGRLSAGTVWFMRELGYEAYVTTDASTVRMLSILEGQGEHHLSGLTGEPQGGLRPSNALILRAGLEINRAEQQIRQLDERIESEGANPDVVAERTRIETRMTIPRQLLHDYMDQFNQEIGRSSVNRSGVTRPPAVAPPEGGVAPAVAEAQALTTHLDAIGAERPSGAALQPLSEPVLVLIDRAQGLELSARQIQIREHLRNIETLRNTVAGAESLVRGSRLSLMAEMAVLAPLLEQELEGLEGEDRDFIEREVERLREGARTLESAMRIEVQSTPDPASGGRQRTRLIVEQPINPEWSPFRQRMEVGFGLAGRAFGSVMIYHTVSAQSDLVERLNNDDMSALEALAGTAHNAYGFTVGVRMARLIPVHIGEFAILAVLDFTQTALADYDTRDQRRTAIAFSAFSNALNLALFAIGGAMMRSPNPYVAGAGFVVMMLGGPILHVTGANDAFERWMSFDPSEVTGVRQELRDAMTEYRVLVGSIQLAERSVSELSRLGAENPVTLHDEARESIAQYRREARDKEGDIVEAFEAGYRRARESYSGLLGLDLLREQFAELHQQAFGDTSNTVAEGALLTRFQNMEEQLDLSDASPEFIRDMEQWDEIDDKLDALYIPLFHSDTADLDWTDLTEDFREAESMLQNARYRLNPQAQGSYRIAPLLQEGSTARRIYTEELQEREARYSRHISRMFSHSRGTTLPVQAWQPHAPDRLAASVADANGRVRKMRRYYELTLEEVAAQFNSESLDELWGASASLQRRFDRLMREAGIEQELYRLQAQELAMDAAASQAQSLMFMNTGASDDELRSLSEELEAVRVVIDQRKDHHGIIYRSELRGAQARIRTAEIEQLAMRFGAGESPQLSEEERTALETDELEDLGEGVSSVRSQLHYAEREALSNGHRDLRLYRMESSTSWTYFDYSVRSGQDAVFAWTGWSRQDHDLFTGGFTMLEVVPITRDAVQVFGTTDSRRIDSRDLTFVSVNDVLQED